ncbi:calcium/sodium antiporter [Mameliella sp. MMSF_3552]|uniref:calcium/sodium antiporter n=1 Tax=unclassified Mameliella TaxID=2630630 RepID=UPI003531BC49
MMDALYIGIGLLAMIAGGDLLVRGAVAVARVLRVPPMVIGLTLVGFGTSSPELVTSLQAALSGAPGIAVGNVLGSNIGNVLLILGIAALVGAIAVDRRALMRDGTMLLVATGLGIIALAQAEVGRIAGGVFVAVLSAYLAGTLIAERRRASKAGQVYMAEADLLPARPARILPSALTALAGLGLTILGARFLVEGAVGLAAAAGVSETLIGLTIVAIGTSAPELVTSIMAVRKGEGDVAFGNIIGSNIFNLLGILGVTALVTPIAVPAQVMGFDVWVMLATTLLLLVFAVTGARISRREGAVLLAGYAAYLGWLILQA